jgi:CheY-like chemotaxis protein
MMRRRILLVDDEVTITRGLALYLEENGRCDVRVENTGSRAVAAARQFQPDLILLDIVMPDADGGAIAAEIKADPALHATPIVFLTALVSRRETGSGSKQIGGHPFLAKPVDPDVVLGYIEQFARRAGAA